MEWDLVDQEAYFNEISAFVIRAKATTKRQVLLIDIIKGFRQSLEIDVVVEEHCPGQIMWKSNRGKIKGRQRLLQWCIRNECNACLTQNLDILRQGLLRPSVDTTFGGEA